MKSCKLGVMVAIGVLVLMLSSSYAQQTGATAAPQSCPVHGKKERHPEIRAAIRALERAQEDLQKAAHDFGGHRVAALKACGQALQELKLALESDKN